MKNYVEDERANSQLNLVANLVSQGKTDEEIADMLTGKKVVNLVYDEVYWTPEDVQRLRFDHKLASEGMKLCTSCGKQVRSQAIKCRHCGKNLTEKIDLTPTSDAIQTSPRQSERILGFGGNLAALSDRFVAALLDGLILIIPYVIAGLLIPIIGALLVGAAYYLYCFSEHGGGRTLGYRAMNLRLLDEDTGEPVPVGTAGLWYIIWVITSLFGWIWFFTDSRKRMLHNIASHTVVIQKPRTANKHLR